AGEDAPEPLVRQRRPGGTGVERAVAVDLGVLEVFDADEAHRRLVGLRIGTPRSLAPTPWLFVVDSVVLLGGHARPSVRSRVREPGSAPHIGPPPVVRAPGTRIDAAIGYRPDVTLVRDEVGLDDIHI